MAETDSGDDPAMVRAGAAAAARRRELNVSQRSLAADGVINAGALIAFEKGRSWPREATRAKLEAVLKWPPGTIEKLRHGEPVVPGQPPPQAGAEEIPLIAMAVVAAVHTLGSSIDALPDMGHPDYTQRATAILADLRQLEAVAARAAKIQVTPQLIKALSSVRGHKDELMLRSAAAPRATVGQRLYAVRRRANLTVAEIALAAGLSEDAIGQIENDEQVPAGAVAAVEALISQID